jgi:Flp pilus assembly protein TadG
MLLTRFWKNRQGSVAPLLGIAIIPLMGAVDYTRASAARTAFQASLDSAALMLSKTAALQTNSQLQTEATNYINALFTATNAKNVTVTVAYSSTNGSQLVLNGSATINTTIRIF